MICYLVIICNFILVIILYCHIFIINKSYCINVDIKLLSNHVHRIENQALPKIITH